MWITTQHGHISVVADPISPQRVIMRAHRFEHIRELIPEADIWQLPRYERGDPFGEHDYYYRAVVQKSRFQQAVAEQIDALPLGTFRHHIADPVYYDACNRAKRELYRTDLTKHHSLFDD